MSNRSLLIALVLIAGAGRIVVGEISYWSSPLGRKTHKTTVTDKMLQKGPRWGLKDENPPLSARRALQLAEKHITAAVPADKKWTRKLESIGLVPADDRWFWKVDFEWWPVNGGIGGVPPHCTVIILMDGTIVPDKIEDDEE